MPSYTLGEIMSLATADIGRRGDLLASDVSMRANIAYFHVAQECSPQDREQIAVSSTTSGEARIDLPSDCEEVESLVLVWSWQTGASVTSSRHTLNRMSVAEVDQGGGERGGVPKSFAFWNTWLELYPSPNSAYSLQIRYRSGVTDLTALTDVPSLSTPWRHAVYIKLKERLYEFTRNWPAAAGTREEYRDYTATLKSDEARRQTGAHRHHVQPLYPRRKRT